MTNLDNILKSRDITLPTKVHLVKAMVFPVVTYGCESWTVKKAEHQRIDACCGQQSDSATHIHVIIRAQSHTYTFIYLCVINKLCV